VIPGKQHTLETLLSIAWRRKWLMLVPTVAIAAAVFVVAHYLPNRYRSETLILVVPQRVPESYVRSTVTTRIEDRLQSIGQQIMSRTRLERIIQEFDLYSNLRGTVIMEDIVERMRGDIGSVDIVRGDAFRIGFTADDPRTAMRVTERLASFFIDESLRDREVLAEGTNQFLESQLEDARRRLIETEKKLEEYRRLHDGELPTQLEANMQGLHNTEMQVQALVDSISRDRDRLLILERTIADADTPEPIDTTTATLGENGAASTGSAVQQLLVAEANLRALELRLTPEHPDVVRMKRIIAGLRKRAESEAAGQPATPSGPRSAAMLVRENRLREAKAERERLQLELASKTAQEQRLRAVMGSYQNRIEAAPARESELTELMRDYETLQETYKTLGAKQQESQISANLERRQIGEQFKILDPARLPEKPSSPNRPQIYMYGMAGALFVGLLCAGIAEYFDRGLRSEDDVRLALNLPVLATIPLIRPARSAMWRRTAMILAGTGVTATLAIGAATAWTFLG
jgi:polysaccharide chain length determinant protein (PEP-CTERM system associated)